MKRIIVNGYGWSGSSAFIDLLNSLKTEEYCIIPGEFDDFRCPGTMRNALENNSLPISHRTSNLSYLLSLFVRGLIPNKLWPTFLRGKNIGKEKAYQLFINFYNERKIFKKYAKLIFKNKKKFKKKDLLKLWFNTLVDFYKRSNPNSKYIFIEQFFLFDDDPKKYEWLEFDKLIIFIRSPYFQLQSTLESKILFSNYPWQAQFLIGAGEKFESRKFELFLQTTNLRYIWIKNFLKRYDRDQIIIIDFDDFLYNHEKTIRFISNELGTDIHNKENQFNILNSQERNKVWDSKKHNLGKLLEEVNLNYQIFKKEMYSNYKNMHSI